MKVALRAVLNDCAPRSGAACCLIRNLLRRRPINNFARSAAKIIHY